jgi:hypothetical protein
MPLPTIFALHAVVPPLKVECNSTQINPVVLRHASAVAGPLRRLLLEACFSDRIHEVACVPALAQPSQQAKDSWTEASSLLQQ